MSGPAASRLALALPCLLQAPAAPDPPPGGHPLIVFLHGVGERGDGVGTLDRLLAHSLPAVAARGELPDAGGGPSPFLVASPQTAGSWADEAERVGEVIAALVAGHGADPARVHVTGISLGSVGAWEVAARVPGVASIAPVSWAIPDVAAAVGVPAWVEVGARDEFVDADEVRRALFATRPEDERTRLRVDPDGAHVGAYWDHVYRGAELYEWLLRWRSA
ncbi:hypothetical protein [Miltoncostaea oceani]|uniref:carboxylesterase family protein n=1 Tax=Miltoncostaea oceani TaxID=2843216 RepID=UPI001C3E6ECF|nr:hypothetical protein [Miltoncostaea oceani]